MRNPFKRRRVPPPPSIVTQLLLALPEFTAELKRNPIPVKHEIRRYIPRPSGVTMIAERDDGQQYRNHLDLTYKQTMRVNWPLDFFTERNEDRGRRITLSMLLEYDPRDRT